VGCSGSSAQFDDLGEFEPKNPLMTLPIKKFINTELFIGVNMATLSKQRYKLIEYGLNYPIDQKLHLLRL